MARRSARRRGGLRLRDEQPRRRPGHQGRRRGDRDLTVTLRLFAAAREAAGATEAHSAAPITLGELLQTARRGYGDEFATVLESSRVWVNGDEPPDGDATVLRDGDEVAVLPPVSGGS
ncbi:MAG: MoaD/ThiS family protein [Acidimicrobiia bacterium]